MLLGGPARLAEAEPDPRPIVSFLGVYDAVGNDARSHQVERVLDAELLKAANFSVVLPAALDAGALGQSARQELLASKSPELRLSHYQSGLGDYILVVRIVPDPASMDGTDLTSLRLVKVTDSSEQFFRQLPGANAEALKGMAEELDRALAPAAAPAPAPTARLQAAPSSVRLELAPVVAAQLNLPIVIEAKVVAPSRVFASVLYRHAGETNWLSQDLLHVSGDRYVGSLPPLPGGEWQYYVHVTDADLNELATSGSADHPHRLVVEAAAAPPTANADVPAVKPTPQPPAPAPPWSAWRKVGLSATIVGSAALLAGIGLGLAVRQQESQLRGTYQAGEAAGRALNSVNTRASAANALMISGGAIAAGGVGLVIAF